LAQSIGVDGTAIVVRSADVQDGFMDLGIEVDFLL
jgi:hypothetical protein